MEKGIYLTQLDYIHESHTYNNNQEQIEEGIININNDVFNF